MRSWRAGPACPVWRAGRAGGPPSGPQTPLGKGIKIKRKIERERYEEIKEGRVREREKWGRGAQREGRWW